MRGNVGFPAEAVGRVHLRPGEGITGFAAERMRPVSVAVGKRDAHFKYIPGLGEEKYPALLAVPIVRAAATTGVLVLQRSVARSFSEGEVVLATALAAVINHALERGEERERQAARQAERRAVRLPGRATVGGSAMGRAEVLPTLSALHARRIRRTAVGRQPGSDRRTAADGAAQGRRHRAREVAADQLRSLSLILEDWRFRAGLADGCAAPAPLKALSALARSYARVAFTIRTSDRAGAALIGDRAAEIEDLCVFVYAATLSGRPLIRHGAVVVSRAAASVRGAARDRLGRVGFRRRGRRAARQRDGGAGAHRGAAAARFGERRVLVAAARRSAGRRIGRGHRADQPAGVRGRPFPERTALTLSSNAVCATS